MLVFNGLIFQFNEKTYKVLTETLRHYSFSLEIKYDIKMNKDATNYDVDSILCQRKISLKETSFKGQVKYKIAESDILYNFVSVKLSI